MLPWQICCIWLLYLSNLSSFAYQLWRGWSFCGVFNVPKSVRHLSSSWFTHLYIPGTDIAEVPEISVEQQNWIPICEAWRWVGRTLHRAGHKTAKLVFSGQAACPGSCPFPHSHPASLLEPSTQREEYRNPHLSDVLVIPWMLPFFKYSVLFQEGF